MPLSGVGNPAGSVASSRCVFMGKRSLSPRRIDDDGRADARMLRKGELSGCSRQAPSSVVPGRGDRRRFRRSPFDEPRQPRSFRGTRRETGRSPPEHPAPVRSIPSTAVTALKEHAMKFLCLICAETVMEQMSAENAARHFEEYREFTAAIRESGHFVDSNRLLPPHAATTIRVRKGKVSVTDGPYAETKEQLGGYYVIEAKDLDEAIEVASRIPGGWIGCVELRPIAEDEQTLRALGYLGADAAR
ncbi:MAG TPA: YciI family protein [Burkholderiaceae bacterium]|nr:YciI family protein [Burkholderiaceae bacterium]